MNQLRDRNAVLLPNEIEAIKATQEIIKRMSDNSQKLKTFFWGCVRYVLRLPQVCMYVLI